MNVAVLGLGFMGSTHVKAWSRIAGAKLSAVMSSDERKLAGDLTGIEGNLGTSGGLMDFSAVRKYRSVEAAIGDPDVDVVDICLPTDLHASAAIAALRAGKHVVAEKPFALDYAEAMAVIDEARRADRILMCAQVLRFIPAYSAFADRASESGPPYSAFFRRRCAAPAWSGWLGDPARGGGVFDLLIHDADYCISLWGLPRSVRATGHEDLAAGIDVIHAELIYEGFGHVIVTGGWHHPKSYPFSMEFTIVTREGTFEWSSGAGSLKRYGPDGAAHDCELGDRDPFTAELDYFAGCAMRGLRPVFCPPEQSAQAVALMRFMLESRRRNGEVVACKI